MSNGETHSTKAVPLHIYIEEKIDMLESEFKIKLKFQEVCGLRSCRSEKAADRYAHDIIMNRL